MEVAHSAGWRVGSGTKAVALGIQNRKPLPGPLGSEVMDIKPVGSKSSRKGISVKASFRLVVTGGSPFNYSRPGVGSWGRPRICDSEGSPKLKKVSATTTLKMVAFMLHLLLEGNVFLSKAVLSYFRFFW